MAIPGRRPPCGLRPNGDSSDHSSPFAVDQKALLTDDPKWPSYDSWCKFNCIVDLVAPGKSVGIAGFEGFVSYGRH